MGNALDRENLYQRLLILRARRLRTEKCLHLLVQTPPQESLGFENFELPSPLRIRIAQALIFPLRFVLTLKQITTQKGPRGVFKSSLRTLLPTTRKSAGYDQEKQKTGN
jgi:hypothetical protein